MKMLYWSSTLLVTLMIGVSAYTYVFHKGTIDGVRELGFPNFFRIQLVVLKVLGILALLVPWVPMQVKEWAYAGVGLFFITAVVAHICSNDPIGISLISVVFFILLAVSNFCLHRMGEV